MAAPNMEALTASLEKSFQNISLKHHDDHSSSSSSSNRSRRYASGDNSSADNLDLLNDSPLDLHSETPLPHFWEQCLDLKTGELYYINWRTGMKCKEDPRKNLEIITDSYSEEDNCYYDSCYYDSEGSSSESYQNPTIDFSSIEESWQYKNISMEKKPKNKCGGRGGRTGQVLVVAGCKSCLMYFMVAKQENDCPKCYGQLLHFD